MTGIERLRELSKGMHNHRVTVWQLTDDAYEERFGVTKHGPTIKNFLSDIADQIEREQDKVAKTDWEAVRDVADDMVRKVFGIAETDAMVERWARTLDDALDGRERCVHDPAADVSMSAYDLLPQEDRDAIAWVREHGGLDQVKIDYDVYEGFSGLVDRIAARLGVSVEGLDDQDAEPIVTSALDRRLMPEGMEWPRFEDGEPVRIGDVVSDVEVRSVVFRDGGILLSDCTSVPGWGTWRSYKEPIKRPSKVLDADGVEIRVGDTVYDVEDGCELVVTKVTSDAVFVAFEDVEADKYDASQLTHERPDSWERLEEDARSIARDIAWNLGNWSPSDFEDVGDDVQARVVDLVRRAKALAGVSE